MFCSASGVTLMTAASCFCSLASTAKKVLTFFRVPPRAERLAATKVVSCASAVCRLCRAPPMSLLSDASSEVTDARSFTNAS